MLRIRKGKKDEIDDSPPRSPSPIITQQPLPLYPRPRPSTSKQYGADPLYPRPQPSTSKQYGADRTQKVKVPLPTESGNKILEVCFC